MPGNYHNNPTSGRRRVYRTVARENRIIRNYRCHQSPALRLYRSLHVSAEMASVKTSANDVTVRKQWTGDSYPPTTATRANLLVFNARCNIYISRLCYDVSVRLSVRLSVTEVHLRVIANLGFKFRSQFTAHCGREHWTIYSSVVGAREGIIAGKSGGIFSRYVL